MLPSFLSFSPPHPKVQHFAKTSKTILRSTIFSFKFNWIHISYSRRSTVPSESGNVWLYIIFKMKRDIFSTSHWWTWVMQGLDGWKLPAVTSLNFSIPRRRVLWNCFIGSWSHAFPEFSMPSILCHCSKWSIQCSMFGLWLFNLLGISLKNMMYKLVLRQRFHLHISSHFLSKGAVWFGKIYCQTWSIRFTI